MSDKPPSQKHLKKIATLLTTRGATLGLQLGLQILVARLFGASATGALQLFTTLTTAIGELCVIGVPANNMRNCAKYDKHTPASLYHYLWTGSRRVLLVSALVSGTLIIFAVWHQPKWPFSLLSLVAAIVAYTQIRCVSEALKALNKPQLAILIEGAITPLFVIMSITVGWALFNKPSVSRIIEYSSLGFYLALAALLYLLKIRLSGDKENAQSPVAFSFSPFNQWRSLWLSGLLSILYGQFALIALPFFSSQEELGQSAAALRFIGLSTTFLLILASMYAPKFSREEHNPTELRKILWQTQALSTLIFLPFAAAFLLFPTTILSLFGDEFISAAPWLQILTLAQLINAVTGIPGVALNMIGKAHIEQNILIFSLVSAIIAAWVFGNLFGTLGVIVVFSILICLKNLLSYGWVQWEFNLLSASQSSTAKLGS